MVNILDVFCYMAWKLTIFHRTCCSTNYEKAHHELAESIILSCTEMRYEGLLRRPYRSAVVSRSRVTIDCKEPPNKPELNCIIIYYIKRGNLNRNHSCILYIATQESAAA